MIKRGSFLFIIVFLSGLFQLSYSQQIKLDPEKAISQYNISFYSSDNGMPGRGALSVCQTSDGYIWFATYNGLVRFDGLDMTVFSTGNTPDITNNSANCFFEDKDSTLWIGTYGGLVSKKNNDWNHFGMDKGLPSDIVETVFRDSRGMLWIGTTNGLCYYQNGEFSNKNIPDFLKSITIKRIFQGQDNKLWIATSESGLFTYIDGRFTNFCDEWHLPVHDIRAICQDSYGKIWYGTDKGLFRIMNDSVLTIFSVSDGLPSDRIKAIYEDRQKVLWIGTDVGLARLYNNKFSQFVSTKEFGKHDVTGITMDFEGSLWVTSYDYGAYCLKGSKFTSYTESEGLNAEVVYAIFELQDNSILIGANNGLYNFKEGKFEKLYLNKQDESMVVRDIYSDKNDNVWICTKKGLIRKNQDEVRIYTVKDGLCDDYTRMVYEDNNSNLWIGTRNGLSVWDGSKFTNYNRKSGLANDLILSLYQDSEENMWIATRDGVNVLKNGVFEKFTEEDGLRGTTVFKFYEQNDGSLLICTNQGINRYYEGIFSFIGEKNGLPTSSIYNVFEKDTTYWFTCNLGIFTVSVRELNQEFDDNNGHLHLSLYDKGAGMKESQCVANSRNCMDHEENMWFATYRGIVKVNPDSLLKNTIPPIAKIEFINLDNEPVDLNRNVEIASGVQRVEVKFTGLSFVSPENVKLKYILQGFDRNWNDAGKSRTAIYTSLPPGKYYFRVKACNNDGYWSNEEASVLLVKKPKFYQSVWFYIILAIVVFLLTYIIYRWRIRAIEAKNKELERIVKIRTEQILTQKEEIEAQAENLIQVNEEIHFEKEKSEGLLKNIFPAEIVDELKHFGKATPKLHDRVSVMFTDFKGFTHSCEKLTPDELVNELHEYFVVFDSIIEKYRIEKIKTIGDAYMCASGLFMKDDMNVARVVMAGVEIQNYMNEMMEAAKDSGKDVWSLRLGIHTGEIVAGVVGMKKFAYDIWGDTVNIASRMESSGDIGKVNISETTYSAVKDFFECTHRGKVSAKNKGEIHMYFVNGLKDEYCMEGYPMNPNDKFLKKIGVIKD